MLSGTGPSLQSTQSMMMMNKRSWTVLRLAKPGAQTRSNWTLGSRWKGDLGDALIARVGAGEGSKTNVTTRTSRRGFAGDGLGCGSCTRCAVGGAGVAWIVEISAPDVKPEAADRLGGLSELTTWRVLDSLLSGMLKPRLKDSFVMQNCEVVVRGAPRLPRACQTIWPVGSFGRKQSKGIH